MNFRWVETEEDTKALRWARVRFESTGAIGSRLELEGELLQLPAFTSGPERRTLGRIARPSRRAGQ